MKVSKLISFLCVLSIVMNCFVFAASVNADGTDTVTVTNGWGDVNNDGALSASDYASLAAHLCGVGSELIKVSADVNNDGSVTAADLSTMAGVFIGTASFSPAVQELAVDDVLTVGADGGITAYTYGYVGIAIPAAYNGVPVSAIAEGVFENDKRLQSITIPADVATIGVGAFAGCTKLDSVVFESNSSWKAGEVSIPADDLADPQVAATYLTDTYSNVEWTKTNALSPDLPFTLNYVSGTDNCYTYDGTTLTFTAIDAITEFAIEGEMTGNIVVDVGSAYKFTLEMRGFNITCDSTNPIYAISADEFELQAKSGTQNYIYDKRAAVDTTDETLHPAAVYAEVDMEISGKGSLNVVSDNNKGIHAKDDLQVKNLTLAVTCEDNCLRGNDSVEVTTANTTLIARTGDCIKTTNSHISTTKNEQKGNILINGGTHNLYAACDGIDAAFNAQVDTATTVLNIYTDKYSPYSKEVTAVADGTYYLRYTNTYYKYSVRYRNSSTGAYEWVNVSDTYKTVTSSGNRPGSSGTTYYYYTFPKKSGYDKITVYMYSSTQTQGEGNAYYACSEEKSINSSYDTVAIAYSSSGNSLSVSWTNYTTSSTNPGGGGPGGGMNEGNSDKGTYSTKGIKSFNEIIINEGIINIQAYDDAIHANSDGVIESGVTPTGNVTINGGTITVSGNDDGVHADGTLSVTAGTVKVTSSYEGMEGAYINISGGSVAATSSDDGFNSTSTSGAGITISGGNVYVYAGGDGVDSNSRTSKGAILFSGGNTVIISTGNGNASIDSDGGYTQSGNARVLALMPTGGMSSEATNGNYTARTVKSSVSLTSTYCTVTAGGTVVLTVKMPKTMTAHAVYLGNSSATIASASSSTATLDSNGVYWN